MRRAGRLSAGVLGSWHAASSGAGAWSLVRLRYRFSCVGSDVAQASSSRSSVTLELVSFFS